MRRHIFAIMSLLFVASQLSACVVYERPVYHPYYHWWYR
jgi:hypothetical protein